MNDAVDEFFSTYTTEITTFRRADIAARILAGLAARGAYLSAAEAADHAVELADALIRRLEQPTTPKP